MAEGKGPASAEQEPTTPPDAALVWDHIGQFLEFTAAVGGRIANRNLVAWRQVAERLRSGEYNRERLAADAVTLVGLARTNVRDLWSSFTDPPERERVAGTVPTVFLFFARQDKDTHDLVDPVLIRIPAGASQHELPPRAYVALSGGDGKEQSDRVSGVLSARLQDDGMYLLDSVFGKDTKLDPGVYDGLVYITDPPYALASIRVVVEGPPPPV
jgi:hypothetical protein